MTELDIEMALLDIGRATDSLLDAAEDVRARGYVAANRTWLLDEVNRLSEILVKVKAGSRRPARRIPDLSRSPARPLTRGAATVERHAGAE
jgi:hypothetical protein